MDAIDRLLADLAATVRRNGTQPNRWPRRPMSVLLHGPGQAAMTVLGHRLADQFGATVVQIDGRDALPTTNGGVGHRVSDAIHTANQVLPSIVLIVGLEEVLPSQGGDGIHLRAAHDLLSAAFREIYGASHLTVATYIAPAATLVPRRIRRQFEHVIEVDVPEIDEWLGWMRRRPPPDEG